jgi:hypothetical protein
MSYSLLFSEPPYPVVGDALKPFKAAVPDSAIESLKKLLALTPIPEPCYENTRPDLRWGIGRDWLVNAVDEWKGSFSWLVSIITILNKYVSV